MLNSYTKDRVSTLISLQKTAKHLEINRGTLYQWITGGLIVPQGSQRIDKRTMYWFDPDYINQVKALLPKKRSLGGPLLSDDVYLRLKSLAQKQKDRQAGL